CAPHGLRRCDVCILGRVERRRLDWARVERAGAAWRRFCEIEQLERAESRGPKSASVNDALASILQFFDAGSMLGSPHFPCSRELVLAAHKVRILLEHPDLGGSTERAAKVNSARDQLLAALDSRRVSGW